MTTTQLGLPTMEECARSFDHGKPTLSYNARLVLDLIKGFSKGAWGYCGAFQRTLAAKLGRSVRWLASALAELRQLGLLTVQLRGPHAAAYRLQADRVAELLQSFSAPSSITERKESEAPRRKPPKRAPINHDALDKRLYEENDRYLKMYQDAKIPRVAWPMFLRAWA